MLKMISDLEKKKRVLEEWEACDKAIKETKVSFPLSRFL